MKQNAATILRWIAILPISCAVYVIFYWLFNLLHDYNINNDMNFPLDPKWIKVNIIPLLGTAMSGFLFVFIGSIVAPNYNKTVGITLLVIIGIVSGIAIGFYFTTRDTPIIYHAISQLIGAALAVAMVSKKQSAGK